MHFTSVCVMIIIVNTITIILCAGTLCNAQDPIDGYYRLRPEHIENVTDIVDIVGTSERCKCHGRSEACERETGQCLVLVCLLHCVTLISFNWPISILC